MHSRFRGARTSVAGLTRQAAGLKPRPTRLSWTIAARALAAAAVGVSTLGGLQGAGAGGDPVVLGVDGRSASTPFVAASGRFVAVAWGSAGAGGSDVFLAVSRDAGRTFAAPVQVNTVPGEARLGGELPPRVALSRPSIAGPGAATITADPIVTVLWTARGAATEIKTARSRDGGRTFDPPVVLQAPGAAGDRGWPSLAIDAAGTAHAIWLDHRGLAAARGAGGSHAGHRRGAGHDGVAMAQKSRLFHAVAGSAGAGEHELTTGVCYCCKTALAAGPDGALYAAWRHVYPGNIRDIAFTVSRDGGRSFTPPARVHEDGWAIDGCPDDGPAMAVDAGGVVHLVWPTVLGGDAPLGVLYYATSADGRAFSQPVRVPTLGSPKPTHPQIIVDRTGRAVVAWDEVIEGRRVASARTLALRRDGTLDAGAIVTLSPAAPAMYPVLARTDDGVVAVWTTGGESPSVQARMLTFP